MATDLAEGTFTQLAAPSIAEADRRPRQPVATTPDVPTPVADAALDERLQRLAQRSSTPRSKRKKRHPAKKARIAAGALSLVSTFGFTAAFAATDGPSSAVITASGGVVEAGAETVVNGDVFTNKWGPVQVQVTFSRDGTLAAVDAVQVPFADGKSVRINNRAVPALNSQALSAQSSSVDTVSGATYTSVDYERSLQSAIDAARAAGLTTLA